MSNRFVCGTCEFNTSLPEKLQSHYQGEHNLSHSDAWAITRSNIGELMRAEEWYVMFYDAVKQRRRHLRKMAGIGSHIRFTEKGVLQIAKSISNGR